MTHKPDIDFLFPSDRVVAMVTDEAAIPIEIQWICGCIIRKNKVNSICSYHAEPLLIVPDALTVRDESFSDR